VTDHKSTSERPEKCSLFRTALDAALILVAGLTLSWFLSALLIQPLVIDRGGRAGDAARMSIDLGAMLNPGGREQSHLG